MTEKKRPFWKHSAKKVSGGGGGILEPGPTKKYRGTVQLNLLSSIKVAKSILKNDGKKNCLEAVFMQG